MMTSPWISPSVTVSPASIFGMHGEPFLDGPRSLDAMPPFPFSPFRFSQLMERDCPFFSRKIFCKPQSNIIYSSFCFVFFCFLFSLLKAFDFCFFVCLPLLLCCHFFHFSGIVFLSSFCRKDCFKTDAISCPLCGDFSLMCLYNCSCHGKADSIAAAFPGP